MTNEDERRKKRRPWWEDDLFENQLEAVRRMIAELMERLSDTTPEELFGSDTQEHLEEVMKELQKNPMVWGFSATIGPDGRMHLNPFGNLQAEGDTPKVKEEREPLVEVMNQEKAIIVIAEIPGVKEDDISLKIASKQVIIRVSTEDRKYAKTIELPAPVTEENAQIQYSNGILELKLQKI